MIRADYVLQVLLLVNDVKKRQTLCGVFLMTVSKNILRESLFY